MNLAVNARDAMPQRRRADDRDAERRARRGVRARARRGARRAATSLLAVTRHRPRHDRGDRRPASSSRSSPPRAPGKGTGWAWRRSTASSSRAAATSRSTASRGAGTTFKIYLPRVGDAAPAEPSAGGVPAPVAARHRDDPAGRGRGRACGALRRADRSQTPATRCCEAGNGEEALRICAAQHAADRPRW